jgi:hypothetical protein
MAQAEVGGYGIPEIVLHGDQPLTRATGSGKRGQMPPKRISVAPGTVPERDFALGGEEWYPLRMRPAC